MRYDDHMTTVLTDNSNVGLSINQNFTALNEHNPNDNIPLTVAKKPAEPSAA